MNVKKIVFITLVFINVSLNASNDRSVFQTFKSGFGAGVLVTLVAPILAVDHVLHRPLKETANKAIRLPYEVCLDLSKVNFRDKDGVAIFAGVLAGVTCTIGVPCLLTAKLYQFFKNYKIIIEKR